MTAPLPPAEREELLNQILLEYLETVEAGLVPDRESLLSQHPELQHELAEFFDSHEAVQRVSAPLREAARDSAANSSPQLPMSVIPEIGLLGDFRLLREIGRGGMGVVYEAEQLSLRRRVALKVLPFVAALDSRQLQRFKTEAMAAAQLHHTNIVPVHAVGVERGVHFYAMQLIEGRSLATVIRELRGEGAEDPSHQSQVTTAAWHSAATVPNHPLTTSVQVSGRGREGFRSTARLVAQVADALEFAHEAGVIHRDIKPANLLLDTKGAIWVTDFGLAQVVADVGLTQTGDLVGTLRYMSPEQAAGRRIPVDHRADVYSLGATLYELLTLQPIFNGSDRVTLLHQILNEDPRPPRSFNRAIPEELETIVLKATAKSPEERYATAGQFAADLRRFLDEIPILARRPTPLERARKWMRRHPSIVVTALLLLASGFVGLSVTTALVSREHAMTKAALERESQRALEAESHLRLARGVADEMIRLAEKDLSQVPFQDGLRKQLLSTSLEYYQQFIDQSRGSPAAQADLAETSERVKRILKDLAVLQTGRLVYLLWVPAVLDDLDATESQRLEIAKLERLEHGPRRPPGGPKTPQEQVEILDDAREDELALENIFTSAQLQRLRQISTQVQGPLALFDYDVAKSLTLSGTQKDRIREILMDNFQKLATQIDALPDAPQGKPDFGPGPPPGFGGPDRNRDERPNDDLRRTTLSVLNETELQLHGLCGWARRWLSDSPTFDKPGGPRPRRPDFWHDERVEQLARTSLDQAEREALSVLTPAQRERWQKLIGPPYLGYKKLPPPPVMGQKF